MTSTSPVCGFSVVRLPSRAFDDAQRGAFAGSVPDLDGVYYGGFDRMPWFDIDELILTDLLPTELRHLRTNTRAPNFSGIDLARKLPDAERLLSASNHISERNEIVAVYSDSLAQLLGTTDVDSTQFEWLGFDVAALGHSSLLLEGIFANPLLFDELRASINSNGLLSNENDVDRYLRAYRSLAAESEVEPLFEEPYPVEAIRIARVDWRIAARIERE